MKRLFVFSCMFLAVLLGLNAQTGVKGTVVDNYEIGITEGLVIDVQSNKTIRTDFDGNFTMTGMSAGKHTLKIVNTENDPYDTLAIEVDVVSGQMLDLGVVKFESNNAGAKIELVADKKEGTEEQTVGKQKGC